MPFIFACQLKSSLDQVLMVTADKRILECTDSALVITGETKLTAHSYINLHVYYCPHKHFKLLILFFTMPDWKLAQINLKPTTKAQNSADCLLQKVRHSIITKSSNRNCVLYSE